MMAYREILDCESLITEVQRRPALYDFTLKEYSDKKVKKELWTEVCEAVYGKKWSDLTPEDRKEKGLLVQRRWKSLRECFRRELKAQKSEDGGSYRKKYMYFDKLLFLTGFVDERPTCNNCSSPQCDQVSNTKIEHIICKQEPLDDVPPQMMYPELLLEGTSDVTPIISEPMVRPQKQRKIKENTNESSEEELTDDLKSKSLEDIDEDKLFLMSLLPKFKKFNDDQKFEAQIEILKVMRRVQQNSTESS